VIAAGYHGKSRGSILVLAKFRGQDGSLAWHREIESGPQESMRPTSLVLTGDGGVLVAASSWNGSLTMPLQDRWTLKVSLDDGATIWQNREPGIPTPWAANDLCSKRKLLLAGPAAVWSVGSVWNGANVDVRADLLSAADGSLLRSISYNGAAGDHDLFRDAAVTSTGEIVVALASSRCPGWLKPLNAILYLLGGGFDWKSVHSETSAMDDDDPYNYGTVVWKSRPVSP
jgi:hypothetical protein